jgi:hypothetical protein
VPIVDRSPHLSPARRRGLLSGAGLILAIIITSGIVAAAQPISAHLK